MLLNDLIEPLAEKRVRGGDVEITGIAYDSRTVGPGMLFVAFKGGAFDGHDFVADALSRGAAAVVAERDLPLDVPLVVVPSSRAALPALSARFYDYPTRKLTLVGVTGTNGKTTTTYLVHSILQTAGRTAGLIGTLGARIGDRPIETEHTTPESADLQSIFARMVNEGVQAIAMEVSSHGLVQGRTDWCEFDCAVFTNLTQDHLDFHESLEDYLSAKLVLFRDYPKRSAKRFSAAVNADDPSAGAVTAASEGAVITYGVKSPADVAGSDVRVSASGVDLVITYKGRSERAFVPVGGYFNAYNGLAAAAAGLSIGIDLGTVVRGLSAAPRVPGRFESIDCGQSFGVLVDYAHTPDGLENVLTTARKLAKNRLIAVFGCGGNRDRGKRPKMGKIASDLADVVIVTSDNPRKEDPAAIVRDILEGIPLTARPEVVIERREAIERAIMTAQDGDLVVIAGKGHEDYQIFADRTIHFDDREVAREILAARCGAKSEKQ
ncbi:MAG: UDP-N-acetylmuramoyl-L-alanyl-D-glutamate--2,6-diaminopimelate ligase [Armatimonadetes bacterium]|nr:UDP-N-acetylmuramoyl-L-alanyl-D-glutamate--2,6-diaminopimelate ligase [Armatimonadota bacterium]